MASRLPLEVSCDDACCEDEVIIGAPIVSTNCRLFLNRRVRLLVTATISYNVVEAIVAITAGTIASSTALIGFGLDSVVEVSSAAIVAWQFSARDPETRERTALRVLAGGVLRARRLCVGRVVARSVGSAEAEHSTVGIVLASVSLLVMPLLSYAQRRTGRELGSLTAVADSKQTLLCTLLSAVLLVGLVLNSMFGWSWAVPIAGLVIAAVAVKEVGSRWTLLISCSMTCSVVRLSSLNSIPIRVERSTRVATALAPRAPMIKSASQWPGIARSAASAGRSEMLTIPTILPRLSTVRLCGRRRSRCRRRLATSCFFSSPPAWTSRSLRATPTTVDHRDDLAVTGEPPPSVTTCGQ